MVPFSNIRNLVLGVALLLLASGIGYRLGELKSTATLGPKNQIIVNQAVPSTVTADFSLFWDVWQRLFRYYIDSKTLDVQKMMYGAISGMVSSLDDPYTAFFPPKENKEFKEDLGGEFEGIGAQLGTKDNQIIVIAPLKGNPAEKAGIRAGDYILKVDGEETVGWTVPEAVTKIRGPRGTSVLLTILHQSDEKPVELTIERAAIMVPSVEAWVKPLDEITEISELRNSPGLSGKSGTIAYIALSRFGDKTNDEWLRAVDTIVAAQKQPGIKGLIFDLRNNPGGYLDGSVFIASEFIRKGTVVTQENSDGTKEDYEVNRLGKLLDMKMVVLVNKGSASAAEITAGALRDYKRATIVGETTFGKGSVQTPQDLSDGSSVHITTAKWLLPKGDWIHKKGITPDIEVAYEGSTATSDAQLARAIQELLQ